MSRLRTIAQALAGPASLLLIVIGAFWKLVLVNQFSWIEAPDIANQVIPWFNYQAQQFHLHNIPIWDPFLFGGQSMIGQGQPGLAYPLNWILFALPLHNGHINFDIVNWYFVSIHYFAALFCYLLCRDLGRSKLASVLAGVGFGLGGYVASTDWPQMINGAIWGPLVFLFLFRAARGVRPVASAAFSGLFLGVSWLSGHHQIPVFLTLAAGAVWLYFLLESGRWNRSLLKPAAVFLLFFVCAGALQILPAYEYGHLASRWVGSQHDPVTWKQPVPYYVHQQYSLGPIYLLGIVIPGYWTDTNPYAGVIALSLAGLALASFWKTKEVRILCGVGVAGLFLALAKNDVFQGILYSVLPFFDKVRSPGSAIYLFQFAIAVLLGFGLDALFLPATQSMLRRLTRVLLGFATLVALIIFAIDLGRAFKWEFDDRVVMCPLLAFALAGLIYRSSRGDTSRRWLSVLLIGLYMVDLGNLLFFYLPSKDDNRAVHLRSFDATRDIAKFLKEQPPPVRSEVIRADIEFNFGDWYGMDTMTGILPSLPTSLCNLDFVSPRAKALYGTNFTVSRNPTMAGQQTVFRDSAGLTVFSNPDAFPRVWTVHQGVQVKNARDARTLMQDSSFDLRKQTFGYAALPLMDECDGDTVRAFERGANFTTAVVDMRCRGMLVQSENNAPGWVATVDGKRTPIYEAYTTIRGVVVGPGTHTVEMHYRPVSVFAGAAATLLAFIGAIVLSMKKSPQTHADARE